MYQLVQRVSVFKAKQKPLKKNAWTLLKSYLKSFKNQKSMKSNLFTFNWNHFYCICPSMHHFYRSLFAAQKNTNQIQFTLCSVKNCRTCVRVSPPWHVVGDTLYCTTCKSLVIPAPQKQMFRSIDIYKIIV